MILIISAVFPPEPVVAARISHDLAMALSEKHEVTVLSPRPTRPCGFVFTEKPVPDARFEHIVLKSYTFPRSGIPGRLRESYSFGKHVTAYIKSHHDKIEGLYLASWPLIAQYLITNAAQKYRIKSVIHVQDLYPESLSNKIPFMETLINRLLIPLDKTGLNNASQIVTISDRMKMQLEKSRKITGKKIRVVKNWQDEGSFTGKCGMSDLHNQGRLNHRPFVFMYLGNIGPVAGVDFLIKSFVQADLNDARLIIAGSGSQRAKCMHLKEDLHAENVVFMDVPPYKVAEIQSEADAMLLPVKKGASISSIPSKLPSYMFSKKPIIACVDHESDIAAAIRESGCGWVLPPENPGALIRAMHEAVTCEDMALQTFGDNGFSYAMKNYSKRNNLNLLVSVITQTINS